MIFIIWMFLGILLMKGGQEKIISLLSHFSSSLSLSPLPFSTLFFLFTFTLHWTRSRLNPPQVVVILYPMVDKKKSYILVNYFFYKLFGNYMNYHFSVKKIFYVRIIYFYIILIYVYFGNYDMKRQVDR